MSIAIQSAQSELGIIETSATCELHVLGAGGMMAGELLRLASAHPRLRIGHAITRTGGEPLSSLHPHLTAHANQKCVSLEAFTEALADELDTGGETWLVLALPHAKAAGAWRELRAELGPKAERLGVLDLSADYRLADLGAYAKWYGQPHVDPEHAASFVYGLPELGSIDWSTTRHIAAPGCFATALQLACVPAAEAGLLKPDEPWIVHAVTGSSGSGAKPKALTHHPHRHADYRAYASDGHRHEAELNQALAPLGIEPNLCFLPHSGPWARGIHLSAVLPTNKTITLETAVALFQARYAESPFVHVRETGVPDLRSVVGSNVACLGVRVRKNALVVELTLDNLIKGGSGQALQALNLALGYTETEGLPTTGMGTL